MKIFILDRVIEFDNKNTSGKEIVDTIISILNDSKLQLAMLNIDDVEIYSDFENYINQKLNVIESIVVTGSTREELLKDNLLLAKQYLIKIISNIPELAAQMYASSDTDWNNANDLFEGITWLYKLLKIMENPNNDVDNIKDFVNIRQSLDNLIAEMGQTFENKDLVLFGDILSYELMPLLQSYKTSINQALNIKEETNGLN